MPIPKTQLIRESDCNDNSRTQSCNSATKVIKNNSQKHEQENENENNDDFSGWEDEGEEQQVKCLFHNCKEVSLGAKSCLQHMKAEHQFDIYYYINTYKLGRFRNFLLIFLFTF